MTSDIIKRRPRAGKRPLRGISSSVPMSVGKLCLVSIALATIGTQAPLANAAKGIPVHRIHNLRGGSSSPSDEISDQELDEYIDFLLAYADNKATEEDNPLFKEEDPATLLENLEESTAVEEETVQEMEILEPLVDDVNNDTQIDAMVETLVASVDDKDLEDEEPSLEVADSFAATIETPPIEMEETVAAAEVSTATIEEDEEPAGESESFFLGSSAVDNMPPPATVEETAPEVVTTTTSEAVEEEEQQPEKPSLFSSFMQKIGLKKDQEIEEVVVAEVADVVTEEIAVEEPETVVADIETPVVESTEAIEEPVIESPLEETTESSAEIAEEELPKPDRMQQLMAPLTTALGATKTGFTLAIDGTKTGITTAVGATKTGVTTALTSTKTGITTAVDATKTGVSTALNSTKTGITTAVDTTKTGVTTAFDATKTGVTTALDNTKTGVTTAIDATTTNVKSYYQGALGSVKGAWKNRPFQFKKKSPVRDYSKIYHKYFATTTAEEVPVEIQQNPLIRAVLQPFGSVKKFISDGAEDSYSIGITGHVTEDSTEAEETESSQVEIDDSTAAADDLTVEVVEDELGVEDTEIIVEEYEEDADVTIETAEVEEVTEDPVEAYIEEVTEDPVEAYIEEVTEDPLEVYIEEVVEDTEAATEIVEVVAEELEEDVEESIEVAEDEDISEEVEMVEEALETGIELEDEIDSDTSEDVEAEVAEEDIPEEIELESGESPAEVPRKATFFKRLWGTTKMPNTVGPVDESTTEESDSVEVESTTEESLTETAESIDDEESTLDESSRKPSLFARLWGVSKEPKEIYSLGLQGTADEEIDVDVSVSIGIVEEDESLDDLEISESSGVEDIEDEIEEAFEDEQEIAASVENTEDDRNVFQLHVPETQDATEDTIIPEPEPVEVTELTVEDTQAGIEEAFEDEEELDATVEDEETDRNIFQLHEPEIQVVVEDDSLPEVEDAITTSDVVIEEDEISTLQLHQEDAIRPLDDMPLESDVEVVIEEDSEESIEIEAESETEEEDILEESEEEEMIEELVAADIEEEFESEELEEEIELFDEEEDVEEDFVEAFEDEISDESEEVIEVADDVEEEESFEAEIVMDVVSDEIEDEEPLIEATPEDDLSENEEELVEEEELEQVIEDDTPIEILEEEEEIIVEEIEMDESDEEEVLYYEEADEDVSPPYSLEVELQNSNFVTRFLVNRGLEQVIMFAILISEWFRAYILAPFLESFFWIKKGKAQDLLQTVMKTRGGAAALSEAEDEEEVEEEDEGSDKESSAEATDVDNTESGSLSDNGKANIEEDAPVVETTEDSAPEAPRVPPNFLFRRLLDYGYWGHLLIMEIILAVEWVKTYVPDIPRVGNYITYDVLRLRRRSRRGPGEPDNLMNAGFVNTGEGSRLGRLPKKMRKKEDQKALAQLQDIGDVNEAKYRFVSTSFLQRHEIGPYNVAVAEVQLEHETPKKKKSSSSKKHGAQETDDEEESDSGWIMDALGVEKEEEEPDDSRLPFDTSVGVSMGSSGPSVSVGVEFNIGGKKKKKVSSLRSVLESSSSTRKIKRSVQPRVSDSESGLMGRLRAQGANSLVGRSILGAYPGDLPPPDEAADARGVIDMAERYGYGDWSDDEDDEPDDFAFDSKDDDDDDDDDELLFNDEDEIRPKTRSKKKSKAKRRRSSPSKSQQNIQIGASIDLGGSSRDPPPVTSVSSRKRRKRRTTTAASSTSIASSLSGSRPTKSQGSSSQLPSLAMEKLGKPPTIPKSTPSADAGAKDILSVADKLKSKTETKTLKPAMSLLDKAKKADETTVSKSETQDKK